MSSSAHSTAGPITVVQDLPEVTIRTRSVSSMDNNVYLITSKTSGTQVLIDAADDPAAIMELLASAAVDTPCHTTLAVIITTHQHWDHVRALAEVSEQTQTSTAAGTADADAIQEQTSVTPKVLLNHGDAAHFDGISLDIIGLRGHTPGSVALAFVPDADAPTVLFTGDSLFPGGVGNTQNDSVRFTQLFDDVTSRIFDVYDDDTIVLPGHGASTTLGQERPHLDEWRARGW
ncbi:MULTISPECIES: MBL fold metallo-hydrolase [Citricoccus]|uniref:MBL fold metallo-hydrolase n=1 Tax=Citricoccus muralis TaxID=169134 RepID=A0ABY8H2E1_9MICC|nr:MULTISPECIES: MBL fold metallo-hydrolase [Citricoccus]WBL18334.1 MBL fold metallo-hydrolase [Citricoccus sp. NR2]WFP15289.1 MBL fold metallo-hydrolase [Citricoccus muralis]